ncbi:1,2-phenylacetyl-CoA epoxidase subunit PaaE [Ramlibacter sp.]|uniref:1,2-phenylacetyl-CoA epoxidase subunit PaaE n=1 Tax=Ramlibacter sp. TaxID=1917967 RepID=UPI003D13552A
MAAHFHPLPIKRVTPDAAGAAAITFEVPQALAREFEFRPGQFLTLRATIDGREVRRNYSICSPRQRFDASREIDVGIKPVEGGVFSRWAVDALREGATLDVMPPDGRFSPRMAGARHRVGFAAGSGITPILSIVASTLAGEPGSSFTLVYCNQRMNTIMFNEALQDLKDRYPSRLTLVNILSRQPQETALLQGRLDEAKVTELLRYLVPPETIDEAFVCGPEGMIEAVERTLLKAGVSAESIHAERFLSPGDPAPKARPRPETPHAADHQLDIVLDGKTHHLAMSSGERVLDVALDAGLDLPYSCKGGVCCTCRARVLEGEVHMEKNYTLEAGEMERGFVLTCQSRPLTARVVVSYDER